MPGKAPYYRGVRGSAALATRPLDADGPAAEALPPGEMRRVAFAGELLGAVRVRASYAALPLDAFDRAGEALEALEQVAYLHLLRLSLGEGRNWCRAAKRDLQERLRLTERRLLRVLDALVAKGFVKPLHRDNRGTLWRVYLPREAFGERLGDDVLVGRVTELRVVARGAGIAAVAPIPTATMSSTPTATATSTATQNSTSTSTPAATPTPTAIQNSTSTSTPTATATATPTPSATPSTTATRSRTAATRRGPRPVHDPSSLARALAEARGAVGAEAVAAAAREVDELLAEGASPERIAACIETVRRRAARAGAKESA